jgi:hypothetical protein
MRGRGRGRGGTGGGATGETRTVSSCPGPCNPNPNPKKKKKSPRGIQHQPRQPVPTCANPRQLMSAPHLAQARHQHHCHPSPSLLSPAPKACQWQRPWHKRQGHRLRVAADCRWTRKSHGRRPRCHHYHGCRQRPLVHPGFARGWAVRKTPLRQAGLAADLGTGRCPRHRTSGQGPQRSSPRARAMGLLCVAIGPPRTWHH